jgi:hypothetical protein
MHLLQNENVLRWSITGVLSSTDSILQYKDLGSKVISLTIKSR